jgi:hypothetical protein
MDVGDDEIGVFYRQIYPKYTVEKVRLACLYCGVVVKFSVPWPR